MKGACIVAETVPVVDCSSHVSSVWPKSMRRQMAGSECKAIESQLIGGTLREEKVPQECSKKIDFEAGDYSSSYKLRLADSVGKLISGEIQDLSVPTEDYKGGRRHIPHRRRISMPLEQLAAMRLHAHPQWSFAFRRGAQYHEEQVGVPAVLDQHGRPWTQHQRKHFPDNHTDKSWCVPPAPRLRAGPEAPPECSTRAG